MIETRGRFRELYPDIVGFGQKVAKLQDDDIDRCIRLKKLLSENQEYRNFHNDEFMVIGDHLYEFDKYYEFVCNEGGNVDYVEEGVYDFCLYTESSDVADLIADDLNDRGALYDINE